MRWLIGVAARILLPMMIASVAAVGVGSLVPAEQIAYEGRLTRENYDLFLLDVWRRISVPLTRTPYGERQPAWSPDGHYLIYSSNREGDWDLYMLSIAEPHSPPTQITTTGERTMSPAWSPDGKRIAFESMIDGNRELYVIPLNDGYDRVTQSGDSGGYHRLTHAVGVDESPMWSPDGRRITFSSYRDNDQEIHLLDMTTGRSRNITRNLMHNEWRPAFSPDGTYLSFTSTLAGSWEIFTIRPDEDDGDLNTLVQVTNTPVDVAGAVWSTDGRWLVVEVYDYVGTRSLFMLPAGVEKLPLNKMRRLTLGLSDDRFPAWKPMRYN